MPICRYASAGGKVIIFCDTKAECDALATSDELRFENKVLHGDIPQVSEQARSQRESPHIQYIRAVTCCLLHV